MLLYANPGSHMARPGRIGTIPRAVATVGVFALGMLRHRDDGWGQTQIILILL
jgi:hypothetical protein